MTEQKIPILEIRSRLRHELKDVGLAGVTIGHYMCALNHLINFMEHQNCSDYTEDVGARFFALTRNDASIAGSGRAMLHKTVRVLDYIIGVEKSPLARPRIREEYDYPEEYKDIVYQFLDVCKELGRSDGTISQYGYNLSRFCVGMHLRGVIPSAITRDKITEYFANRDVNKICSIVTSVKFFCRYLHEQGILDDEFNDFFKRFRRKPTEKLLSAYTPEEVIKIENSIDRTTEIGKRNYAMILLASRLGLRSSDIRNLSFDNIDWDTNKIRLVQLKTHKELELPLLADVGNAIIDYIKNSRPQSKYTKIFVNHHYPFDTIESASLYRIVQMCILDANLYNPGRKCGPHTMRHSLATALVNNGEPLPVVSDILGHSSCDSTKAYLTVNMTSLIRCSLDVPPVDKSFYHQKGNIFYDRA